MLGELYPMCLWKYVRLPVADSGPWPRPLHRVPTNFLLPLYFAILRLFSSRGLCT